MANITTARPVVSGEAERRKSAMFVAFKPIGRVLFRRIAAAMTEERLSKKLRRANTPDVRIVLTKSRARYLSKSELEKLNRGAR